MKQLYPQCRTKFSRNLSQNPTVDEVESKLDYVSPKLSGRLI